MSLTSFKLKSFILFPIRYNRGDCKLMAQDKKIYKPATYEKYWGASKEVKKQEDCCSSCGTKLIHSHLPDYKNLTIREISRCYKCSIDPRRTISHIH